MIRGRAGARRRAAIAALVVVGVAAGCSPGTSTADPPPKHPTGADDLVFALRPRGKGGQFDEHSYWLYGDRRLVVVEYGPRPFAEPRYYTGEPFQIDVDRIVTTRISPDLMETLLRKIEAAGLLGKKPPTFGEPLQFEGYHNVIVHAGGIDREVTYTDASDKDDPWLTREQEERRNIIFRMSVLMYHAVQDGAGTDYTSDRVALLVKKAEDKLTAENGRVVDWPLQDLDRAVTWPGSDDRGDRCLMATEDEASVVISTLYGTPEQAVAWRWNGDLYRVWPHLLLPHENGCQTAQPYFSFRPDTTE